MQDSERPTIDKLAKIEYRNQNIDFSITGIIFPHITITTSIHNFTQEMHKTCCCYVEKHIHTKGPGGKWGRGVKPSNPLMASLADD